MPWNGTQKVPPVQVAKPAQHCDQKIKHYRALDSLKLPLQRTAKPGSHALPSTKQKRNSKLWPFRNSASPEAWLYFFYVVHLWGRWPHDNSHKKHYFLHPLSSRSGLVEIVKKKHHYHSIFHWLAHLTTWRKRQQHGQDAHRAGSTSLHWLLGLCYQFRMSHATPEKHSIFQQQTYYQHHKHSIQLAIIKDLTSHQHTTVNLPTIMCCSTLVCQEVIGGLRVNPQMTQSASLKNTMQFICSRYRF